MPRQRVEFIGKAGLNTDILPASLPAENWSVLSDVVAAGGSIHSTYGEVKKIDLDIKPLYHGTFRNLAGVWFLIISDGINVHKVKANDGSVVDISPVVKPDAASYVSIINLNSVLVVNYANFGPFYLTPSNVLEKLPGWDINWFCREMVAYRYFLVALNMTENGNKYPHKIRWSSSAEEGAIPTEWVAETSNDAGDDLLGETLGHIIGGMIIREYLYIVKEDALYSTSYIGGTYVMRTDRLHGSSGTQLQKGYVEVKGGIATCDLRDLRLFDGQQSVSLVDNKVRTALQSLVVDDKTGVTTLFRHVNSGLLFVASNIGTDKRLRNMLVYDWVSDVWWTKSLTYSYGFDAIPLSTDDTPRADIAVYESSVDNTAWWLSVMSGSETSSDLTPKHCIATRVGIPVEGLDGLAMVNEAWFDFTGNIPISITFGAQDSANGPVTWGNPETWDATSFHLTPRVQGRYIAINIESQSAGEWHIGSFTFNWTRAGER